MSSVWQCTCQTGPNCCSKSLDVPAEVVAGCDGPDQTEDQGTPEGNSELEAQVGENWTRGSTDSSHLNVAPELLRGIPLKESLYAFGRLWTRSPIDLPERARAALWDKSRPVTKLDMFLSHTWHTPGYQKVRALLVQSGWHCFVIGWFLGAAALIIPEMFGAFPPEYSSESSYQRGPSARLGGCLGSIVGLFMSPYLPRVCGGRQMCFLDVVCIHQLDAELTQKGIYGLGGSLAASSELRVLWSPPYLSRLWCVFELAGFRRANPSGRIVMKPLYLEVGLLYVILACYFVALFDEVRNRLFGNKVDQHVWLSVSFAAIARLPYLLLIHALRQLCTERHHLTDEIRNFELAKVSCRLTRDRDFICACIRKWYGSEEAFEQYVRGQLSEELTRNFSKSDFTAVYWLLMLTPLISIGMDNWLHQFKLADPAYDPRLGFLRYVILRPLTNLNFLHCGLILSDLAAHPGPCHYAKTISIWSLVCLAPVTFFRSGSDSTPTVGRTIIVLVLNLVLLFLFRWVVPKMRCKTGPWC